MNNSSIRSFVLGELTGAQCSRLPFFSRLATSALAKTPDFLNAFYIRYQAAMHATRVMVYRLPNVESVELRKRVCAVIAEDDNLPMGDSHHAQLADTWRSLLGGELRVDDSYFGELELLASQLDSATSEFIRFSIRAYPLTLGPWVVVEGLAHDWIAALCESLSVHFPSVRYSRYFVANFASGVELGHSAESLDVLTQVLAKRPQDRPETMRAVQETIERLHGFWRGCEELL